MNKTKLVVIGSLALAGIGAYFYFKPKASETRESILENKISELNDGTSTSQISVPPKGTVLSTPEEVQALALKITDAKNIATKLKNLKAEKQSIIDKYGNLISKASGIGNVFKQKVANLTKEIETLNFTLKGMGYTESDGGILQIV